MKKYLLIIPIFLFMAFNSLKAGENPLVPSYLYQEQNSLQIYPNPAVDFIKVKSTKTTSKIRQLEILDIVGNLVFKISSYNYLTDVNINQLRPGKYFIKVKFLDNSEEITQLIKE